MSRVRVYPHKPPADTKYTFVLVTNRQKLIRELSDKGIGAVWIWRNISGLCAAWKVI